MKRHGASRKWRKGRDDGIPAARSSTCATLARQGRSAATGLGLPPRGSLGHELPALRGRDNHGAVRPVNGHPVAVAAQDQGPSAIALKRHGSSAAFRQAWIGCFKSSDRRPSVRGMSSWSIVIRFLHFTAEGNASNRQRISPGTLPPLPSRWGQSGATGNGSRGHRLFACASPLRFPTLPPSWSRR
jgi:hypothetical protein